MKDTRLLQIFQNMKDTLCRYDYYIHTSKKTIHLSNTEDKIPHLMGLQFAGRPKQYTGDFVAYAVKKGRITMQSLEKLVQKYYKTEEKQRRILEVIHLKLDNLLFLPAGGIRADEKLVTEIVKVNLKFGIYHTIDMLNDEAGLLAKCMDKREKALVSDFLSLWEKKEMAY